jgi:hypothetical protein
MADGGHTSEELPGAVAVTDPFHVVRLGGDALDQCRRRVQQTTCGHRGRKGDPLYAARRTLHPGSDLLTDKQRQRLTAPFTDGEPGPPTGRPRRSTAASNTSAAQPSASATSPWIMKSRITSTVRVLSPTSVSARLSQRQCAITASRRNPRRVHNHRRRRVRRRRWDRRGYLRHRRQVRRRRWDRPDCCRHRRRVRRRRWDRRRRGRERVLTLALTGAAPRSMNG